MAGNGPLLLSAVFFSLFRDLADYVVCPVERVLGPIMFAYWAGRGRLSRGGGGGDWGRRCLLFVTFLHKEKAAENEGD
jgi:hypothetical protein